MTRILAILAVLAALATYTAPIGSNKGSSTAPLGSTKGSAHELVVYNGHAGLGG
jgi:hypothetical protein